MTYNSHDLGINPDWFQNDEGLKNMYDVIALSYTTDNSSKPFVAAIEAKEYPFFGN